MTVKQLQTGNFSQGLIIAMRRPMAYQNFVKLSEWVSEWVSD